MVPPQANVPAHVEVHRSEGEGTANGFALLLPIRREHADRIFDGSKHFELRKILPLRVPQRVYLYEVGGKGVVGSFDVKSVLSDRLSQLWDRVGNAATTRQRFRTYFSGRRTGNALAVEHPVRFEKPISLKTLRSWNPRMTPPRGFVVLSPGDPVLANLEAYRAERLSEMPPEVSLRPIADDERKEYQDLVASHISKYYDEIDASFARSNLEVHDLGHDRAGFFTTHKEVLGIVDDTGNRIGYSTLTFKAGGSVKTGPTILLEPYREKGYGAATRREIARYVRRAGYRKVYCTCPDVAKETIRYLLASGMRIEAHLERQYTRTHGELVFGQMLVVDEPPTARRFSAPVSPARVASSRAFGMRALAKVFRETFSRVWYPVDDDYAREMVRGALDRARRSPAQKPRRLVCLERRGKCVGMIALLPKRGGAVKALLLLQTRHLKSVERLIAAAVEIATDLKGRKLYFVHPMQDAEVVDLLRAQSFQVEGVLRAPYAPGQDVLLLSKFI